MHSMTFDFKGNRSIFRIQLKTTEKSSAPELSLKLA